jgi:hypothetical protein
LKFHKDFQKVECSDYLSSEKEDNKFIFFNYFKMTKTPQTPQAPQTPFVDPKTNQLLLFGIVDGNLVPNSQVIKSEVSQTLETEILSDGPG